MTFGGLVSRPVLLVRWWVDRADGRQNGWFGWLAYEAFGVCEIGGVEHAGAVSADLIRAAVVHVGRYVQPDAGIFVFVFVPAEESVTVHTGGLDRFEPFREVGPVLQGLELGLGERIVVGGVR